MCFVASPVGTVLCSGVASGLVVDVGYRHTSCTAVIDGKCLLNTHQCRSWAVCVHAATVMTKSHVQPAQIPTLVPRPFTRGCESCSVVMVVVMVMVMAVV